MLKRWRLVLTGLLGLLVLTVLLWLADLMGASKGLINGFFLVFSVIGYALICLFCRTTQAEEYYVAGRRVPALYNGMATAADWMSAASFISLAGALYLQGFSGSAQQPGGLAYILGWTGGFCLVALFIAPQLRAMQLYTLPDFFRVRYGGRWPRILAALASVACSFTYVVAQIYGIGLIASRLTGVQFEIGILLGLGGVLLCSFLGGMRAITWTQVAQYIVLLLAFTIPVSWLAYRQLGTPLAPVAYGAQLSRIEALERRLMDDPAELEVREEFARRARDYEARLQDVDHSLKALRADLEEHIRVLKARGADFATIAQVRRQLQALPSNSDQARELWGKALRDNLERAKPLGGMPALGQAFQGDPHGSAEQVKTHDDARNNFLALAFCLMLGTAGLPHLLTRYYTSTDVAETRRAVAWSLFFIALLYLSAPALAILVKFEVLNNLVGSSFEDLPTWIAQWARLDPGLIEVSDVNGDLILQFGEIRIGADLVMLATPELGGMPFVVSGLVAAGGLAAALSTADGLLLTISNALVHDMGWQRKFVPKSDEGRVILSKFALLAVAMLAAFVAALKPAEILALVSASFSLAAASFFPAMVAGLLWPRVDRRAAVAGMLSGLLVTVGYMMLNASAIRHYWEWTPTSGLWWGVQPMSAGIFGVPAGFATILLFTWVAPRQRL